MKRVSILVTLLILVLSLTAVLAGCGSKEPAGPSNLEEYVASDENLRNEIQTIADSNGLDIAVVGNMMTFTYKYTDEFDAEMKATAGPLIEQALSSYADTFKKLAKDMEEQTGLSGISIKVQYLDVKDSELYSTEYKAE